MSTIPTPSTSTHSTSLTQFPLPPTHQAYSANTMPTLAPTTQSSDAPLGPLAALPPHVEGLKQLRILLLVTSVNSFTQRVLSYLQYLGFEQVSVQLAISDEEMAEAAEEWDTDLVLCPFLTKKLPESIYTKWITLVVHPGPPGDAGPSSLDWVLLGDDGSISDSAEVLQKLLSTSTSDEDGRSSQRSHWGTICFQANEELDGGAGWAWEQYALPPVGSITKAQLYQGYHSAGAMSAVIHALCRVYEVTAGAGLEKRDWLKAVPKEDWSTRCVSLSQPFLGGPTHDRPLLQSTKRRPNWEVHTAEDIHRILNASDSQPGAMLHPLTTNAKASLFAYGAHVHKKLSTIHADLYTSLGYRNYDAVPNGKIIATRQGAVFIKTRQAGMSSAGIWITHGRVPRGKDKPIDPKIPMVQTITAAGHGAVLEGVKEWEQDSWAERAGEWQEVYVRTVEEKEGLAQLIYWNFYNGAFTTENCKMLLRALQWATSEERGNVKILALMGGTYFSNGIALNTIENASSPGEETWDNINAIDDLVSFLVGDTSSEVPSFLENVKPLAERGITTIACVRGNAAAGGVAFAAACDVVLAARGVVLNPSYRAMGLHGSELHSYSYLKRCGPVHAAAILREMKPVNAALAHEYGLIDVQIGSATQTTIETEPLFITSVRSILSGTSDDLLSPSSHLRCAPWCLLNALNKVTSPNQPIPLVDFMCTNKLLTYANRDFPPLLHFRNEELSQMLLDSFHPVRSERYHSRRYKFVRKVKADSTPARYMIHVIRKDAEDTKEFDDAPGWVRGEEWKWAGLETPKSLETSEKTRIPMLYDGESVEPSLFVDHLDTHPVTQAVAPTPERKHSEAPTMSTLPSLHASGFGAHMTPTTSSSGSEGYGPTTPMLNGANSSPAHFSSVGMEVTPSDGSTIVTPQAKPSTPSVPAPTPASVLASKQAARPSHAHSSRAVSSGSQDMANRKAEKEKSSSKFKSLRKKVKSALRSLNGDSSPSSIKDKQREKNGSKSSLSTNQSLSGTSLSTTSAKSEKPPIVTGASNAYATVTEIAKSHADPNGAGSSDAPKLRSTFNETQNRPRASSIKDSILSTASAPVAGSRESDNVTKGECEWPCLVNGGEEEAAAAAATAGVPQAAEPKVVKA